MKNSPVFTSGWIKQLAQSLEEIPSSVARIACRIWPFSCTGRSTPLSQNIEWHALSEIGKRNQNQDNYLAIIPDTGTASSPAIEGASVHYLNEGRKQQAQIRSWPQDYIRVALADGMGGHEGGQAIAQRAMEKLIHYPPTNTSQELYDIIMDLHRHLYDEFATRGERSPGTTIIVADIHKITGHVVLASLGDSRAYIVNNEGHRQLTYDHTYEEFDWREKEISDEEYYTYLQRQTNSIVQALGYGSYGLQKDSNGYRPQRNSMRVRLDMPQENQEEQSHNDVIEFYLRNNEALFLASDGLWSGNKHPVWDGVLTDTIFSHEELEQQAQNALAKGSKDNITVLSIGFIEEKK